LDTKTGEKIKKKAISCIFYFLVFYYLARRWVFLESCCFDFCGLDWGKVCAKFAKKLESL